jgi:hypothetical protein
MSGVRYVRFVQPANVEIDGAGGSWRPPFLLQQIPDLEHGFHTPASLGES